MSQSFAQLLKGIMDHYDLKAVDIACWVGVKAEVVTQWQLGHAKPEYPHQIEKIVRKCRERGHTLSNAEVEALYSALGFQCPPDNDTLPQADIDQSRRLDELMEKLGEVNTQLATVQHELSESQEHGSPIDDARILGLIERVYKVSKETENITDLIREQYVDVQQVPAKVDFVSKDYMLKELLRADLDRLNDAHGDENMAYALLGIVGGAFLGVIANVITAGGVQATIVSLVFFGIATIAAGFWLWRLLKRSKKIMDELNSKWRDLSSGSES